MIGMETINTHRKQRSQSLRIKILNLSKERYEMQNALMTRLETSIRSGVSDIPASSENVRNNSRHKMQVSRIGHY